MKWNELVSEIKSTGSVLIARCGSGRSFYGEVATAESIDEFALTLVTESGAHIRVEEEYGTYKFRSKKYRYCFIARVDRMSDPNFYANTIN